jgi:hypothetical protein
LPLLAFQLFDDHLKPAIFQDGYKLVKSGRLERFLPFTMTVLSYSVVRVPDSLHGMGLPQYFRRGPKEFEAHELVGTGASAIPRFATQVFQALGVEMDRFTEIWAADQTDGGIKLPSLFHGLVEFRVCKTERRH